MAGGMAGCRFRLFRLISAAASPKPSCEPYNLLQPTRRSAAARFGGLTSTANEDRLGGATLFALPIGKYHINIFAKYESGVRRVASSTSFSSSSSSSYIEQLQGAKEQVKEIIKKYHCNPILIRLAWHDAGTYDKNVSEWPKCGGANGSIRFSPELNHAANAGLQNALRLLEPVKQTFPHVSFADLFQLASATAVELAGGPKIPMRYGRVDTSGPEDCAKEGNLPAAGPPDPAKHLREVFYRMGFNDKEIVVLSGAHTLGRSRPERSGWGVASTKYTKDGPGAPGGQSWTAEWLKFDNYYFKDIKEKKDKDLLVLPTDAVLFEDPSFKVYAETYVESKDAFFKDYSEAHAKLSELGSKFQPSEGLSIDGAAT